MDCINEIKDSGNRNKRREQGNKNGLMLPFGPVMPMQNNFSVNKYLNNNDNNSDNDNNIYSKNRNFSFGVRNPNQKFVSNPLIKSQNIILRKLGDNKDNIFY